MALTTLTKRLVSRSATCWTADSTGLTLTEILPSSLGRCAARNQSPGSGLVTLNAPVVRFGRVHVRVTAKDPGTIVSRGKLVSRGLMTGGAPDLKYLLINKAPPPKKKFNPCPGLKYLHKQRKRSSARAQLGSLRTG